MRYALVLAFLLGGCNGHPKDSFQGDGICDVLGCPSPTWAHWTETEDPSSPIVEELCEEHYSLLVFSAKK